MRILNRLCTPDRPFLFCGVLIFSSLYALPQCRPAHAAQVQRSTLVLIGGGLRPTEALTSWIQGASRTGSAPRLGAIAWASGEAEETLKRIREELKPLTDSPLETPPAEPGSDGFKSQELTRVLDWLSHLDGLYFTGGDQNRLIALFQLHPEIPARIRSRFESGQLSVAGTSAGTAIQGLRVFTGNEDLTVIQPEALSLQPGLSLLPEAIVDQHFLRRQRHNRMLSALQADPGLIGVAVDEDTALVLESQASGKSKIRNGKVLGRGQVLVFIPKAGSNGKQIELLITPHQECLEWSASSPTPSPRSCSH